jgi:hypothetical protein
LAAHTCNGCYLLRCRADARRAVCDNHAQNESKRRRGDYPTDDVFQSSAGEATHAGPPYAHLGRRPSRSRTSSSSSVRLRLGVAARRAVEGQETWPCWTQSKGFGHPNPPKIASMTMATAPVLANSRHSRADADTLLDCPPSPTPFPRKSGRITQVQRKSSPANNSFLGLENEVSPVAATIVALSPPVGRDGAACSMRQPGKPI